MDSSGSVRELLTIEEYLGLSAKINYQLSARSLNKGALLALVLGPAEFDDRERDVLLEAFNAVQVGYQQDRRRLGTPGILHPLRAAAIVARSMRKPTLMDLLCALLHDKEEDLTEKELGTARWSVLREQYDRLIVKLTPEEKEGLEIRIRLLSNDLGSYNRYLDRLLSHAADMPELLHVKLADRLDNTFDIHLQHPGVTKYNFYRAVFDILFLPGFRGVDMGKFHFMPDVTEGSMLLSQLFKDTIFLALLRKTKLDRVDSETPKLFVGLAVAGIREAQWLALEMFHTCYTDVEEQRKLLMDVMEYCQGGGIAAVTTKDSAHALDGMLIDTVVAAQQGLQKRLLSDLFQNREQLAKMVLAFIVIFASFINDPDFTIEGIDNGGINPQRRQGPPSSNANPPEETRTSPA